MRMHLAECHWMPKMGRDNKSDTLLRFGGVVGDKGGKGGHRQLDEEHFINSRTTVRVRRNNIIQKEGWQGVACNTAEKRIKHFEISA